MKGRGYRLIFDRERRVRRRPKGSQHFVKVRFRHFILHPPSFIPDLCQQLAHGCALVDKETDRIARFGQGQGIAQEGKRQLVCALAMIGKRLEDQHAGKVSAPRCGLDLLTDRGQQSQGGGWLALGQGDLRLAQRQVMLLGQVCGFAKFVLTEQEQHLGRDKSRELIDKVVLANKAFGYR